MAHTSAVQVFNSQIKNTVTKTTSHQLSQLHQHRLLGACLFGFGSAADRVGEEILQENNLIKDETRRPCRTKNDRTAGRVGECSEQQSSGIMRERGRVRQRERLEIVGVIPWPSVALSPSLSPSHTGPTWSDPTASTKGKYTTAWRFWCHFLSLHSCFVDWPSNDDVLLFGPSTLFISFFKGPENLFS